MKPPRRARRGLAGIRLASAILCLLVASLAFAAQLSLSWTDNAGNEDGFQIERRPSPSGTYVQVATLGPNVTAHVDTTVTAGQAYCYRVHAYNGAGFSGYSNEACGTATVPVTYTLTVATSGTGTVTGTAGSPPSTVVNCPGDCTHTGPSGTQVTLAAAPGAGFTFSGWSGGGCTGTGTCTVTLTQNTTVTATFAADAGGVVQFSASAYSVAETADKATITVNRMGGAANGATVEIAATGWTAKPGMDYGPIVSNLTFAANEATKTFSVPILVNPNAIDDRWLVLQLKNPGSGATLGAPSTAILTITKVGIRFSATAYMAYEGPDVATITVNRTLTTPATVMYRTQDGSAVAADGDYTAIPPTALTFAAGQTSKTFTVAIGNNPSQTTNRQLQLLLSGATGEPLSTPASATLTILDKQRPDLQLTAFAPPAVAIAGQGIDVPNTVQNLSAKKASASTLQFVLSTDAILGNGDDVLVGARGVEKLDAGAISSVTTSLTIPANTPPGAYTLFAKVDAGNAVAEQNEGNNVAQASLTVETSLVTTFRVSGDLIQTSCASPLRNGRVAVQGSLEFAAQTRTSLTGTLSLSSPLAPGHLITAPIEATVAATGALSGTFTYTTTQGSVIQTGSGRIDAGQVNGARTTLTVDLTGTHASGETCDFTASLESPAVPVALFTFHHDTLAGSLGEEGGAFVATPTFPLSIGRYRALFDIAVDTGFPPPAGVTFTTPTSSTGPATGFDQLATNVAGYRSSFVPGTASAGAWTIRYKGSDYQVTMPDPGANSRLVVPVPTFTQGDGLLQQVTWAYKTPAGGALRAPPGFMRLMRLQLLDPCGVVLHDSLGMDPATTVRTLSPAVTLASVAEVRFRYLDDLENTYTVHYGAATPGACRIVEFSAPSYSTAENVTPASIVVRRVGDTTGTVTVGLRTSNGTATAPANYLDADTTLTFAPGVTTLIVPVTIVNDASPSTTPKTVLLSLQDPTDGASIGPLGTAVLTINDDEPRVAFTTDTFTVTESGSSAISVQRTGATAPVVSVNYATSNGTAAAPADYQSAAGVLTFLAGETSKTFTVPIVNDLLAEGDQTINLTLSDPVGASLATPSMAVLTVTDNETGGALAFSAATYSVAANGLATITVTRTGGSGGDVTVNYATSNPGGRSGAVPGTHYATASGTLTFGWGEMTKTFTVQTYSVTTNKAVALTLSSPSNGASLRSPGAATLWIVSP